MKYVYEMTEQEIQAYVKKKGKQRAYNKLSNKLKLILEAKKC